MPLPKVSGIDRVAYDPNTRVLQVWLKGSVGPYKFAEVPQDVYDDLRQAASVEAYFESSIHTVTASVEGRTMGLRSRALIRSAARSGPALGGRGLQASQ